MNVPPRYRVVRTVGKGAQGAVLLVEDSLSPGAPLALKIMAAEQEPDVEDLSLEFEVLASLVHPRLARVYDFGRILAGEPGGPATFLTRDFLEGVTLKVAARGRPLEELIRLAVELCRALVPLHRAGFVHGDLKPANAIVDESGTVRLIDFGVVRREGTTSKWVTGTLPYMAPEVISGRASDPRSDLYSMGVMLFELLLGRVPFEGSDKEVLGHHICSDVPSLSPGRDRFPADAAAAYDRVADIVVRLMSKDPSARFPGVRELEMALRSAVPVVAVPPEDEVGDILPPRVGREALLATLVETLAACLLRRETTSSCLVALRGEPGSGKSTLLRELKWHAQLQGIQVVEVACDPSPAPHGPLPMLARRLGLLATDGPRQLAVLLGGSLEEQVIADALAVARRRPLMVIAEDLHLAGPESCVALRNLAHSARQQEPLLVVVSLLDGDDPERSRALGEHLAVDIPPLEAADVARLAGAMLGRTRDDGLAAAVHSWTGGNPLFCVETLRAIHEAGGEAPEGLAALGVPARLEEFWSGRAVGSTDEERCALAAAVVLGHPAEADGLCRVAGLAGERCADALQSLLRRGLLQRGASSALAIAHAGLAPVAERLVSGAALSQMHARAAEVESDRAGSQAEVAHHLLRAGPARAAEACDLALDAARDLHSSGASRDAARLLEPAVRAWEGPRFVEATLLLAEALHGAGDYDRAARLLEAVVPELEGDEQGAAYALLGRVRSSRADFDGAQEAWKMAIRLLSSAGARTRVRRDLGRMLLKRGEYAAAEGVTSAALEEVSAGDPLRADLLCTLGMVRDYEGDADSAIQAYEEAQEIAVAAGARREESSCLTYLAIARQRRGEHDAAWRAYEQSLAIAREVGDVGSMALLHGNLGGLAHSRGEVVVALEHYRSALQLSKRVGREGTAASARANLGLLHLHLGEHESARHELDRAFAESERLGMRQLAAQALAHLGELAYAQGRLDASVASYHEAYLRYEELRQARECAEVALDLATTLLARGRERDLGEVDELVEEARRAFQSGVASDLEPHLLVVEGRLATAREEDEAALELLARAADRARSQGSRELEWQAEAEAARVLLGRGSTAEARERLERAVRILEELSSVLPSDLRKSYWQDPRRAAAREALERL